MFCRGRIFFTIEEDTHQYDDTIEVFWASGGCFVVRAELYHQLGGLDCDLYAHMEEIDLCWRFINNGHRIAYCGASTVYHIGGSVISYGSPQKIFYNYRNSLVLLTKNLPSGKLLRLLPFRLILDGVAGLRAIAKGNFAETWAIIRAHFSYYAHFLFWVKKRRQHNKQKFDAIKNYDAIYQKSIVIDYFARGKKIFSELNFNTKKIGD
jgi:GT2 family glycosyltransferase